MKIPLVDLSWQHREIADELRQLLDEVFARTSFILGAEVDKFEAEFSIFSRVRHCVGVGSGTDALELILRALAIEGGDEVIIPANSFVATAMAVVRAGGSPVLVDVDPVHMLMDVDKALERIGPRTKAVIPVHLYGQMAPLSDLNESAQRRGIALVEDAAQAHGATSEGEGPAAIGVAAGISFYPGKNLGAYGDAGAVITNSDGIAKRVRSLRNWGSAEKYQHPELGFNSRLDTVQAVVLLAKLAHLEKWNKSRREAAQRYTELLADMEEVIPPATLKGNEHVWHLYVVRVPERDRVLSLLHKAGVGAGIHYPIPMHLQGALSGFGYQLGDFPVTEMLAREILSLPIYPGITVEQQQRVVGELRQAIEGA